MSYLFLKDIHNLLRWLVVLSCLWALIRVWGGLIGRAAWSKQERLAGLVFSTFLNVQIFLGLALLFSGPMRGAYATMGATMKNPELRFFAVEHPFMMLLAALIAQAGFSLAKKAATDRARFVRAAVCYTVSALLVLIATPWPFMRAARPWLPSFLN